MNDPNGLVFHDGEYHLFYQHNPFGDTWGHMSWGHAVSRDLLHWEHLPVALSEEDGIMIFSGSAVVDWENTSGFGMDGNPPLIAIYTGHSETEQTQNLAFSTDRGRTWTKYEGNPVLSIGSLEFRDPKVFRHEPTKRWIMVVVLADRQKVRFYGSPNLKHWTHLSDFGPAGATDGAWECPDLFPLPVEGEPESSKWVLKVDVFKSVNAQYFVGDFDGERFIQEDNLPVWLCADHGADFYAAQSWSDEPNGRRIWIGWLNNWHYANVIPTSPWRGSFSVPRELRLRRVQESLRLVQQPVEELKQLRQEFYHVTGKDIATVNAQLSALPVNLALEINVGFALESAQEFGIKICTGKDEETLIGYEARTRQIFVDRRNAGEGTFSDQFPAVHRAPLAPQGGKIKLHIFVDSCSVEVFGSEGEAVISDLIFPHSQSATLELFAHGGNVDIQTLDIWKLS
jgi:fructan beta-fructosidase